MSKPHRLSTLGALLLGGTLATPALAAPSIPDAFSARRATTLRMPTAQLQDTPAEDSAIEVQETSAGRTFDMELGFRGRYMYIPDSIMDIWFFNSGDTGWIHNEDRPTVKGYALGIEVVVKSKPHEDSAGGNNGIFYFQWIDNLTEEGYWDDVEDPPNHDDGDYMKPTSNLGLVTFGANYGYELHMVKTSQTNGNFGMSMVVGAGLGVGILVGEMTYWRPEGATTSIERYANNEPDDGAKRVPPVVPILDIGLGLRFNIADRFVIRVEGGFQDMIYGGGSVGLMF